MRRSSISRRTLTIIALLVALAPAACAAKGGTPAGSAGSSPSDTGSPPSAAASPTGPGNPGGTPTGGPAPDPLCPDGVRAGQVVLTEANTGSRVCLATGASLEVYLHGKPGQEWSQPVPDSPVLRPVPSGKRALQIGVTAGFFAADAPGQARVTAERSPCGGPKPGPACDAIQLFTLTVVIR
ncbi:MAG: hypothetical protein AUI14_21765 [Actinobacteria bacterium 13_2_20CM_2_71_6]|nr:MAG: hypothetical protein AUI14_21765 [Actinobacteria bacterium 13_2_20CM_2_71_6]